MVNSCMDFAWQMEVLYSNGTTYSLVADDLSLYHFITKEAVIQAGELKITFTFYVASGYLWINSTKLLPTPCRMNSGTTRRTFQGSQRGVC